MSAFKRAQHWATFARSWHLFDAKWQNPYESAAVIKKYLTGEWKPIYHPASSLSGDHVVVINSKHIALPNDEWYQRAYFHHRTYPGTATWTEAWQLHEKNDKLILEKAVYFVLAKNLQRRGHMRRLHIFSESDIPADIAGNINNQIRPLRPIPKRLDEIPQDLKESFPQLVDYPRDYVLNKAPLQPRESSEEKP